jgi:endonuclease/exonuclease/phosphatase family metal-dependent hydrolase
MPQLSDQPPQNIQQELNALNIALDQTIPAKQEGQNLLIATWNIRSISSLTRKWTVSQNDSPKRDLQGLRTVCDIVSRYDVIALQEVKGHLRALRDMMNYLGDRCSFLMTDITLGDFNIERQVDELWQAFTSTGLSVPDELQAVPKSIFDDPKSLGRLKTDRRSVPIDCLFRNHALWD